MLGRLFCALMLTCGIAWAVRADSDSLSVVSGVISAFDSDVEADEGSACDAKLRYEPTPQISKAYIDHDGTRHIVLDPILKSPEQAVHRKFLIAHECAHHELKHTTREGLARRNSLHNAVRDQELSADCRASEQLFKHDLSDELLGLADEFWRRGFVSPGQGYPSGVQRSNIIRHCLDQASQKVVPKLNHPSPVK